VDRSGQRHSKLAGLGKSARKSTPARRASFEVALIGVSFVWPKASITVAWGETPGNSNETHVLAEGHIHIGTVDDVNMAFGQSIPDAPNSWGDAPGYGENRPSAKRSVANAQLQNAQVRDSPLFSTLVCRAGGCLVTARRSPVS
jgi:hypothetical protein